MIFVVLLLLFSGARFANGACTADSDSTDGSAWFKETTAGSNAVGDSGDLKCAGSTEAKPKADIDYTGGICATKATNSDVWAVVLEKTDFTCVSKCEDQTFEDDLVRAFATGAAVDFDCPKGYDKPNGITVTCDATGAPVWKFAVGTSPSTPTRPPCVRSTTVCADGDLPSGTTPQITGNGDYPLTGSYSCAGGFKLDETQSTSAKCVDGSWEDERDSKPAACIPECDDEHFTDSSAIRRFNGPSGPSFECMRGYVKSTTGTPTCTGGDWDWDGAAGTCTLPCTNYDCGQNADCINADSGLPVCMCKLGYADMSSAQEKINCTAIQKCPGQCSPDADCVVSVGGAGPACQCHAGFVDKHKDGVPGTECIAKKKFLNKACEECEDDKCGGDSLIAPFLCLLEGFPV